MILWYYISRPFYNLTNKERSIQILRLIAHTTTLLLTLVVLLGPLVTNTLYIGRINCAHLDVSYGLYKSLRNSVSATPTADILYDDDENSSGSPVDSALTNSEISILTAYATAQVANAPQYILTSIWAWCYGNYNITHYTDKHGIKKTSIHNNVLKCSKIDHKFVFDYRQELEYVGLDSILAYAFHSTDDGAKYKRVVEKRDHKYKLVPPAIMFCGIIQLILLIFTIIVYSNRGDAKDLSKIPSVILHVAGLLAVASLLASTIGAGIITGLLVEIRSEIHDSLGSFGVFFHMGKVWLLVLWATQAVSVLASLSWAGPLWCANPEVEEEEEFEFQHPNRKSYIQSKRRTTGDIPQYRDCIPFSDHELESMEQEMDSDEESAIEGASPKEKPSKLTKLKKNLSNKRKRLSGLRLGEHRRLSEDHEFTNLMEENFDDEHETGNIHSFGKGLFHTQPRTYVDKNEEELRKLGESLSKKSSVRRINTKGSRGSKVKVEPLIIEEKEAMDILYHDQDKQQLYPREDILYHYREETYDGYRNGGGTKLVSDIEVESETVPYQNSSRTLAPRPNNIREVEEKEEPTVYNSSSGTLKGQVEEAKAKSSRNLSDGRELPSGYKGRSGSTYSFDDSFLATEEIEFLDTNNFMNKL